LTEPGRRPSPVGRQVARGAFAVAVPVLLGMGLSLCVSIALARWLGAAEFGTYTYVWSWVAVLGTVSVVGIDNTVVSRLPRYVANAAWGNLRGLLIWAGALTLAVSLGLLILGLAIRVLLAAIGHSSPVFLWLIASCLVALTALLRVAGSALRGLHRPAISQLSDSVVVPMVMLGLVGLGVWTGQTSPSAEQALLAQAAAVGIGLTLAVWLLAKTIPQPVRISASVHEGRTWLLTSGRMFLLSTLTTLNGRIGILLLGILGGATDVGPFAVAQRGSGFIALALNISVLAMSPTIVALHDSRQPAALRLLVRQMSRFALLGGIPVALVLIVWGRPVLLLFGSAFEVAYPALTILVVGQLVNIGAGPVATLLVMTGHERDAAVGLAAATVLNGILCLILIPRWGINGAALAAAAGETLWNVILWRLVRRRLAIGPSILGDPGSAPSSGDD
jgi:O-antigen/teichoic acid export membrane protein